VDPFVIYVAKDRTGTTFSLDLGERRKLKERVAEAKPSSRVFIGHDTFDDFLKQHGDALAQVISLLTGVPAEKLKSLGSIEFREPVSEKAVATFAAP
jgi:hypothetical protein